MSVYLSKSRFTLGLNCPQMLVFEAFNKEQGEFHYVDQRGENKMMQGLAEGGHQIGALAQTLFKQADGDLAKEIDAATQTEQIAQTQAALSATNVTLFESTIVHSQFLVRVDVLRKKGNRVDLIEVKSKSFDSSSTDAAKNPSYLTKRGAIHSSYLSYVQDLAFQYWVTRRAYPEWDIRCHLMMPDKAKVAIEDRLHQHFPVQLTEQPAGSGHFHAQVEAVDHLDAERLDDSFLQCIPMDEQVQLVLESVLRAPGMVGRFDDVAQQLANLWTSPTQMAPPPIGTQCKDCPFYTPTPTTEARSGFHQCWSQRLGRDNGYRREDTIFGFYSPSGSGARSTKGLLESGVSWLSDIDPDALDLPEAPAGSLTTGDRQRMQLTGQWPGGGEYYFDREGFRSAFDDAISKTGWPLYFLDFEAARTALPLHAGQAPNSIQIFQYSLHAMEEDGSVRHAAQFLDLSSPGDVNIRMLRSLRQALGFTGTVLRWTSYENVVLNEAREQLLAHPQPPKDCDELVAFIDGLTEDKASARFGERNMVDQAKWAEAFYYHPKTNGKYSIKALLPAVMSASEYLRDVYSKPFYGSAQLPSSNFPACVWWVEDTDNPRQPIDPYKLLGSVFSQTLLDSSPDAKYFEQFASIADGGTAMMAYIRSQSGKLKPDVQPIIEKSLLKYCELDTLAMVMIMQAWLNDRQSWI